MLRPRSPCSEHVGACPLPSSSCRWRFRESGLPPASPSIIAASRQHDTMHACTTFWDIGYRPAGRGGAHLVRPPQEHGFSSERATSWKSSVAISRSQTRRWSGLSWQITISACPAALSFTFRARRHCSRTVPGHSICAGARAGGGAFCEPRACRRCRRGAAPNQVLQAAKRVGR
jgi:hypothetical protein